MEQVLVNLIAEKVRLVFGRTATVTSLIPLAGDASSRRYYRAFISASGSPSSTIVMELGGSRLPLSSDELAVFTEPPQERPFLNVHRFFERIGVRVPELYGHWVDEGLLLLEDLGDVSLWDRVQGVAEEEAAHWYRKAVDQLLHIQIEGTRAWDETCLAFKQNFDLRLYTWEFEHFLEYGIGDPSNNRLLTDEIRFLRDTFASVSLHLADQPRYLNHRDFHSWNLMVSGSDIVVIDFQDALLAPLQYDLASLLNDRETDSVVTPKLEDELLNYYLEEATRLLGERLDPKEFWKTYLLSALQRDFKVVGRFRYLDIVKGKTAYRRFIPPTLARLRRNLSRVPGLEKLLPLLAKQFVEFA